jgi:predicted amidohydrolase YtcJ
MNKLIATVILWSFTLTTSAATLVHNIRGYTMSAGERITFVGLEFDKGKVVRLYTSAEDAGASSAETRIDGQGATLLPGLIDAHGHISSHGRALSEIDLVQVPSEAEAAAKVAAFIHEQPGLTWITGRGWNQMLWPGKSFPARNTLDDISGDKAVVLGRIDGHAMWVNSKALALAGIDDATPDPAGGLIIRDSIGQATGVLIDNAMSLIEAVMPRESATDLQGFILTALEDLARHGVTSVHDAGISAPEVSAMQALRRTDKLPVRIYAMLNVLDPKNDTYLDQGPLIDHEHLLDIRSVKISADGALGSRGAALHADYSDAAAQRGLLLHEPAQLEHHMQRSMKAGYQVNVHAIGDRANTLVLSAFAKLINQHKTGDLRHRVEHAQVLQLEDINRFNELGIVASIQPTHATSDKNMAADRLGNHRLDGAYAWKRLVESGARLAGGSDFPVESVNPFFGLHAAVTRQGHDNSPPGGWLPNQKIDREIALSLFTEWAAWAAHQEEVTGRLLPGYAADFILVRDDYFSVAPEKIWQNEVLSTYVAGRRVY